MYRLITRIAFPRRVTRDRAAARIDDVNMLVDIRTRLTVEVVVDLICPWCFLGVRRLLRAIRRRPDLVVELRWRPFLLNPDMPRGGMSRTEYVARKFGSEERGRRLYASIADLGAAEGVPFRFDRISRTPSSVDAHRLVRFATHVSPNAATSIVDALFVAHFAEGRDVGDPVTLIGLAAENGLDAHAVRQHLAGPETIDVVHGENLRWHRLGINGVPCFIFDGRLAIAGAQEPEIIERLLDVAAIEAALVQS